MHFINVAEFRLKILESFIQITGYLGLLDAHVKCIKMFNFIEGIKKRGANLD